ncbi:Fic/DOC family protein [Ketobacter alkanivorans]|uniref:protein adenylyltransferase n=1 Tax=Ketobacter alkanivorans TaxID=1917421 RepID=A0A2K9LPT2_9GAMM|nr:Fic family protein [Ketobacter alkanivorans]AUM13485.1 cell filamentation protein Fic [Ketobacter alkanivorans]
MSKYELTESQTRYQPGSNDQVLANTLGITDPADMDEAELALLEKLYQHVLLDQPLPDVLSSPLIKSWHRQWLGAIYPWAGEERSVNLSKGDFHFAAASQIPNLLHKLDRDYLSQLTPCTELTDETLIKAIAEVHVEFILIHPFREGNGRIARLIADVMASQAGYGTLDYSPWDENKADYFAAIQAGLDMNYKPMMHWVEQAFNTQ